MRNIADKKGMSLNDMYPAVLTFVLVGIVLGVGLYVLSTLSNSIATDYAGTQNGINTSTGTTTLTDAALTNFNTSALTTTYTNGSALTNFTFTGAGVVTWGADIVADQSSLVNTTYTYTYDAADSPEKAINNTATGLATFADWIAIIVVVLASAIVLGIVLSSFGRKSRI